MKNISIGVCFALLSGVALAGHLLAQNPGGSKVGLIGEVKALREEVEKMKEGLVEAEDKLKRFEKLEVTVNDLKWEKVLPRKGSWKPGEGYIYYVLIEESAYKNIKSENKVTELLFTSMDVKAKRLKVCWGDEHFYELDWENMEVSTEVGQIKKFSIKHFYRKKVISPLKTKINN